MRFRTTLILLLLLAGLGAYLNFVELPRAREKEKKRTLYSFEEDDVTSLKLAYADREIEVNKDGETWRLAKPVAATGDSVAIKSLVSAIVSGEVSKELADAATDLSVYGLDSPFVTLTVGLKDDPQPPRALLGKTTPVGAATYAMREGEKNVLLTSSSLRSSLDKQAKDLRDKTILDFKDDDVLAIDIQRPGDKARVERKDSTWEVSPGPYPADDSAIQTYLSSLRSSRAVEFPDDNPADLTPYGLLLPSLEVHVRFKDDRETVLRFGTELPTKNVYAQSSLRPTVYEVGEYTYRNLVKSARDLRDKTILTFDADDLQTAIVTRDSGPSYKLVRKDDAWSVEGVEGKPKPDVINEWIGDLSDLKGYEIAADNAEDLAAFSLDTPRLRIELIGKDNQTIGTVLFGQKQQESEQVDVNTIVEGGSTIYKLRMYIFTRLNREPSAFVEAPAAVTPAAATSP